RGLDPVDRRDSVARRFVQPAATVSDRSRLARRGDPAGHPLSAGACRGPSSTRRRCRLAPDGSAPQLDPDPTRYGLGRRSLRHKRKLSDLRRLHAAALRHTRARYPWLATAARRWCPSLVIGGAPSRTQVEPGCRATILIRGCGKVRCGIHESAMDRKLASAALVEVGKCAAPPPPVRAFAPCDWPQLRAEESFPRAT